MIRQILSALSLKLHLNATFQLFLCWWIGLVCRAKQTYRPHFMRLSTEALLKQDQAVTGKSILGA